MAEPIDEHFIATITAMADTALPRLVLDRKPNSIVAEALMSAAVEVDFAGILQSALDDWLTRPARSG
jgi:hypothetical protein